MALVISTPTSALLLTQPRYQSPVVITPSGTVVGTTIGISALAQSGWTIDNQGVVWGGQFGVSTGAADATLINTNLIASDGTGAYVSGGVIYNGLNATIVGSAAGLLTATISQITNNGIIAAVPASGSGVGVVLSSGVLLDGASGEIVGGAAGLLAVGPATIATNGLIAAASGQSDVGVAAQNGGLIVNGAAGAQIVGGNGVVGAGMATSTVINLGGIFGFSTANSSAGLCLAAGGVVLNAAGGTIASQYGFGVAAGTAASTVVANYGVVLGKIGVVAQNGGVIVNGGAGAQILGADGIVVGTATASVTNLGGIFGLGTANSSVGLYLAAGGVILNAAGGTIASQYGFGVATGTAGSTVMVNYGVVLGKYGIAATDSATIINTGTIGGTTAAIVFGGAGNVLDLSPTSVVLGLVQGGGSGNLLDLASGASTGTVYGLGSRFTNFGTIAVDANANWVLTGANTLDANSIIVIGANSTLSVQNGLLAGDTLVVAVASGASVEIASAGSVDLAAGGAIINDGTISGGNGYFGGIGVDLASGGTLTNSGTITGGQGGYGFHVGGSGGIGVNLASGGTLTNSGTITAGNGGVNGIGGIYGGRGGIGVDFASGGTLTNSGTITGGNGGSGYGYGGIGVDLASGGTLTNSGAITGGTGGTGVFGGNGSPGDGVYLNGGTLINAGTISGGGGLGLAVLFGSAAATLVIDPGAVFNGLVVGDGRNDTLELASGASAGRVNGLGSSFINFGTIVVDAGASWSLSLTNTLAANSVILSGASAFLIVTNTLSAGTNLTVGGAGTFSVASSASVEIGSAGGAVAGSINVDAGNQLIGGGVFMSSVVDNGAVAGANLLVSGSVTGTGTVDIASGAFVDVIGSLAAPHAVFQGSGAVLGLGSPLGAMATISNFTSLDEIALFGVIATGTAVSGQTLTPRRTAPKNWRGTQSLLSFRASDAWFSPNCCILYAPS